MRMRKAKTLVGLGLLFMVVFSMRSFPWKRNPQDFSNGVTITATNNSARSGTPSDITRKVFIYLVQTESCLPEYLAGPRLLGDASACRCDVVVLSYRDKCEEKTHDHVQYIHAANTTWASGRNLLLRHSRERKGNYHYYIFADDDIELAYNEYANKFVTNKPELRTYENFLLEIEPVVGFVNYLVHRSARYIRKIREHCLNKPDLSLLPLVHFDPILNGFHRDVLSELLPYSEKFDSVCWWHPHRLVSVAIEVKFRGQAVMYPGITVHNVLHRKYPVNNTGEDDVVLDAIEERALAPQKYRNHFTLLFYKTQPLYYSMGVSPTTCMDIVAHRPIKPYAHFEEFPMHNCTSLANFFKRIFPEVNNFFFKN